MAFHMKRHPGQLTVVIKLGKSTSCTKDPLLGS